MLVKVGQLFGIHSQENVVPVEWTIAIHTMRFNVKMRGYQNILAMAAVLTHWSRVTHICVGKLTIIGSDNGLSPERRQAIIWTDAGILLIGPFSRNFSEILIDIQTISLKKIRLKMSSAKWCSFCLGRNELNVLLHTEGLVGYIYIYLYIYINK